MASISVTFQNVAIVRDKIYEYSSYEFNLNANYMNDRNLHYYYTRIVIIILIVYNNVR